MPPIIFSLLLPPVLALAVNLFMPAAINWRKAIGTVLPVSLLLVLIYSIAPWFYAIVFLLVVATFGRLGVKIREMILPL